MGLSFSVYVHVVNADSMMPVVAADTAADSVESVLAAVVVAVVAASLEVDRSYCSIEYHSSPESYTWDTDTTAASQPPLLE
jgi:hypothetical protein